MAGDLNAVLAAVGGLVLLLSLASGILRSKPYLPSEPMLATLFGVAVGPAGLGVLRLADWGEPLVLIEGLARLTIAIAVASIALRLPRDYFRAQARAMAALLGPGMVAMWLVSAAVAFAALDVSVWIALLIGGIVTPTDPVLANSIVVGKSATENVPERLRQLISGEAGANDGAAYAFVLLPILVLAHGPAGALDDWLLETVLREVLGAAAFGLLAGLAVGHAEKRLSRRDEIDRTPVFSITVALTFAVLGGAKLLGMDGILAVFVAGLGYNWAAEARDEAREQGVQEVFNRLFSLPVFVAFGLAIPWAGWAALGPPGLALVAGVLLFRRLPMVLALRPAIEPIRRTSEALFVGWFGPIGIAAVFYATLAARETGAEVVWPAASLVVAGSILVHGGSATVLSERLPLDGSS